MNYEPKLSYYISKSESIDYSILKRKIRLAILSSYTLNGLDNAVRVKCAEMKMSCLIYFSGYDQYNQDILNIESDLYKFSPDISFLILDTRSILKSLFYSPYSVSRAEREQYIDKRAAEIIKLATTFTNRSKSKLVISNFSIPTYSPYGILETKTEYSLQRAILDLNNQLSDAMICEPSIYIYDFNAFVTKHGENNVLDYRQFLFGDIKVSLNYIPYLAEEMMGYIKPVFGMNRKCIVLDLDNTLWGGVVGEEGFEGIELGSKAPGNAFLEFQHHLLSLSQRGIILAINSKNNPADAIKVIKDHPYMILREENFASMRINWNDKISNMRDIAEELNIGLDSMVYIDDDPMNREIMRMALPEVLTVDLPKDSSLYSPTLMSLTDFNVLKITPEDAKRVEMYQQQIKRNQLEKTVSNLQEFLSQLDIKIKIKNADPFTIPRIAQLTLKTNQFNLTTHRYQEEDVRIFSQDHNIIIGCAQVEDKFGDNGITGVFIVKKNSPVEWTIDTFLLSCRVMGRGVENAIMGFILKEAKRNGVIKIKAQYIPTKKNKPCEDFLHDYGFKQEGDYWVYPLDQPTEIPGHLKLLIG
jgi:FkbH-like protein